MNTPRPIHLRSDEYNDYFEEYKEQCIVREGEFTNEEKHIIHRCGVDYGLEINEKVGSQNYAKDMYDYNIIMRVKGAYTLPQNAQLNTEHGPMSIRPYTIHESATAQRLKTLAQNLITEKMVESVVPIDSDYLYEALRESAFNIAMEDVAQLGAGFQILEVEFDANGHFKAIELDETHY